MTKPAHQIKDMQLYARADRILTELRALGINDDDPLDVELLSRFDQLHYHGTLALDEAMTVLSIERSSNVLEIGSGWGGPARYVAARTGAKVTAIELQEDYHAVALGLTGRCGLAEAVEHINGDFLSSTLSSTSFDRIVSWLALYHIPDRPRYLKMAFDLLKPKGAFFAEDLVLAEPISADLSDELSKNIFANSLVSQMDYKNSLAGAGFNQIECRDMTEKWSDFTQARLAQFLAGADAFGSRHGDDVFRALEIFYVQIADYFRRGVIGGVRALAWKP